LWRYVDLSKFLDLATTSTLFLARLSHLRTGDPHEGTATVREIENFIERFPDRPPLYAELAEIVNSAADEIFVNCWHAEFESMAMWKIYAGTQVVALVTSPERLVRAISASPEQLFLGPVEYFGQMPAPPLRGELYLSWAFRKRMAYSFEKEVRLGGYFPTRKDEADREEGLRIALDLKVAFDRIVVAPGTPQYVLAAIQQVTKRWMPTVAVERSSLLDVPKYTIRMPEQPLG
jgi:hypothetical protein